MIKVFLRGRIRTLVVISMTFLMVLLFSTLNLFQSWQSLITDSLFIPREQSSNITIAAIDEESLNEYGAWPWDREILASVISKLSDSGVRVIGLDITFFQERDGDEVLIQAFRNSEADIVLAAKLDGLAYQEAYEEMREVKTVDTGFVNFFSDTDGSVRNANLVRNSEFGGKPSFTYQIINKYFDKDEVETNFPVKVGFSTIPEDKVLINYVGAVGGINTISIKDILDQSTDLSSLENGIVLIGSTVQDLKFNFDDRFATPVGLLPGVEIHANIIDMTLGNQFLNDLNNSFLFEFVSLALVALIFSYLARYKNVKILNITAASILILYIVTAFIAFNFGIIFDFLYVPLLIIILWAEGLIWRYIGKRNESAYIQRAFSQYVNKNLLNQIIAEPERLELGGKRKFMTVMFSDIRGFTSISERMSAEELVQFLNNYLTRATDTILENQGMIDKYLGDAIMALWNAPLDDDNHTVNACRASLSIIEVLEGFNKDTAKDLPELKIGIGINTGDMVVGNMGSERRFDYTVMGDNVNLASRLEGLTKQYSVSIILGENTVAELENENSSSGFKYRLLDYVTVKGKKKPIKIYELYENQEADRLDELTAKYGQALKYYLDGKFEKAARIFEEAAEKFNDRTSKIMKLRCDSLKDEKTKWPGYWEWDTK